ncbi:MAG: GNAT family N-acetyltransferase [bacterium]
MSAMQTELNKDITTERTLLRKYKEADRDVHVRLILDKEVMHFMGGQHPENTDEANSQFDKCLEIYGGNLNGESLGSRHFELWGIEFDGKLIGHFELKQSPNTKGDELEVIYFLEKNFWGKGIMSEVIKAVNSYANSLGKICVATINPENRRTVNSLKKAGIEKEEWEGEGEEKMYKLWLKKVTD